VIWAKSAVRAAAAAMQSVAKEICQSQTLVNVEDRIASVEEIFRLQNAEEYAAAERPVPVRPLCHSVRGGLAASRGQGLESLTTDRPKVMLPIAGRPLLRWLVDSFKKENIHDITVVGGYCADAIDTTGIRLVVNERYARTGNFASLACALDALRIGNRDLLRRPSVSQLRTAHLVDSQADFAVIVGLVPYRRQQSHGARFRLLLAQRRPRLVRNAGTSANASPARHPRSAKHSRRPQSRTRSKAGGSAC